MSGKSTRRVPVLVSMACVVVASIITLMSSDVPWFLPVAMIVAAVGTGAWAWHGSPQRPNKRIF